MAFFKSRAEGYAEPWRSVGATVSLNTQLVVNTGAYGASAAKWPTASGRMTLCGDTAHPMTPREGSPHYGDFNLLELPKCISVDRGQGLNNALFDSANYVAAILRVRSGENSLHDAIDAYGAEVLERGTREMGISLIQTMFIHDWDKLMQSPVMKMVVRQATAGEAVEK